MCCMSDPKIAFVIDALPALGGAERLLTAALEVYPDAPIFTLVYNRPAFAGTAIAARDVHTSFIGRLPWGRTRYRSLLPILPFAIEQLDLRG